MAEEVIFVIPEAVASVLRDMASLEQEQMKSLFDCLNAPALGERSPDLLSMSIAAKLNVDFRKAYNFVGALGLLANVKQEAELNDESLFKKIEEALIDPKTGKQPDGYSERRSYFRRLFGRKPDFALARKRRHLTQGPVKSLRRIESASDLRPLFNLERTEVIELLAVDIVQLTIEDDDGNSEVVVFQVTGEGLKQIEDFIEVLRRKRKIIEDCVLSRVPTREEEV